MTNTQDCNNELRPTLVQNLRPISRFRPDVVVLQHRLNTLKATAATDADEDLRRSRIFDLQKEIAAAIAERDAQPDDDSTTGDTDTSKQAPRHMSTTTRSR